MFNSLKLRISKFVRQINCTGSRIVDNDSKQLLHLIQFQQVELEVQQKPRL